MANPVNPKLLLMLLERPPGLDQIPACIRAKCGEVVGAWQQIPEDQRSAMLKAYCLAGHPVHDADGTYTDMVEAAKEGA